MPVEADQGLCSQAFQACIPLTHTFICGAKLCHHQTPVFVFRAETLRRAGCACRTCSTYWRGRWRPLSTDTSTSSAPCCACCWAGRRRCWRTDPVSVGECTKVIVQGSVSALGSSSRGGSKGQSVHSCHRLGVGPGVSQCARIIIQGLVWGARGRLHEFSERSTPTRNRVHPPRTPNIDLPLSW